MPLTLRYKAAFTLLGCYDSCLSANGNAPKNATDEDLCRYSSLSCGCHKVDGLGSVSSHWIHMVHDSSSERGIRMHHIHWNGDIVFQCDVHVCKFMMSFSCIVLFFESMHHSTRLYSMDMSGYSL